MPTEAIVARRESRLAHRAAIGVTTAGAQAGGDGLMARMRLPDAPVASRALVALAAFGLYWLSAVILQARDGTGYFGADAHLYTMLADGTPIGRITRFHPLTAAMTAVWMKLVAPLTSWLPPQTLYKGMFAAVGAAGVWGAMAAFAAVSPRRHVLWLGVIYATSLGVWYFSSIEESKIVTTTLGAFYIATYLRLRTSWSPHRAVLLTVILLLACLNEIVAAFLVAIPAIDALVRHGRDWRGLVRRNWWIACHALAAPVALLFLEGVVNGWLVPPGAEPEGASHVSMLMYYLAELRLSAAVVWAFAARWLFFNIAAPATEAGYSPYPSSSFVGHFEPTLAGYLDSPVSAGLVAMFLAILAVSLLPGWRGRLTRGMAGIMLGLAAYAALRALFFFIINPYECLLYSSTVTLPHMLLIAIPFAASSYRWRQPLLAGFAALLFIVNATFIVGP